LAATAASKAALPPPTTTTGIFSVLTDVVPHNAALVSLVQGLEIAGGFQLIDKRIVNDRFDADVGNLGIDLQ
jgi:hypothetical protein